MFFYIMRSNIFVLEKSIVVIIFYFIFLNIMVINLSTKRLKIKYNKFQLKHKTNTVITNMEMKKQPGLSFIRGIITFYEMGIGVPRRSVMVRQLKKVMGS